MNTTKLAAAFAVAAMIIGASSLKAQVSEQKNITLEEKNAPGGSIAVVDNGGNLVYLERLDGTFAAAAEVSIKKANTAALFRAPSSKLENSINAGRNALITVGHTFLQGGIPIIYNGQVIGAIGVSGAASAQQDEEIAIAGSKAEIK
jgi:glc operon protein GlcG